MPAKNSVKLTREEFISKAQAVRGDKYDYSQVVYAGMESKIRIICPVHGPFEQRAIGHLRNGGCNRCGYDATATKLRTSRATFIEQAQAVHGNKYDYSRVEYLNSKSKVEIFCQKHGVFKQLPKDHIKGHGCKKCVSPTHRPEVTSLEVKLSQFRNANGDKYDYSLISGEIKRRDKVPVICKTHGVFYAICGNHILGRGGCPKCAGRHTTREEYITRARLRHGQKYDYSRLPEIVMSRSILKIYCPLHGVSEQLAHTHLKSTGCLECGRESLLESQRLEWIDKAKGRECILYFLRVYNEVESFYKVGLTSLSVSERFKSANCIGGYHYEILLQHKSLNIIAIYEWEQSILETFAHLRYKPKQPFPGETECFSSADEILAIFPL